jgi:hypothetical protein
MAIVYLINWIVTVETIQGRKLFAEIRYVLISSKPCVWSKTIKILIFNSFRFLLVSSMYWTCIKEVGLSESNNKSSHDSFDTRSFPIEYRVQKKILSKQIFDPDYGLKGSFTYYVDKILSFYWPNSPLRWHVLPYIGWQNVKLFGTTYPPPLVNVICERRPHHLYQK